MNKAEEVIEATVRHKTNNFLTEFRMEFNEHKTEIALMKKDQEYTIEKVTNIEKMLKWFIESANKKYSTKDEHKQNREDIEKINKIFFWLGTLIIGAIILAVLNLLLWK